MFRRLLMTMVAAISLGASVRALAQEAQPDAPPASPTPTAPGATTPAADEAADADANAADAAPAASATAPGTTYTAPESTSVAPANEERLKVWNSPEMMEGREFIIEYGRRSRTFTQRHAQEYLSRLSQASPAQMKAWLLRFQTRRANTARSADVARAARQTAVDQTLARLQAVQQSYDNWNMGQTQGALVMRQQYQTQQQLAGQLGAARQADRNALIASYPVDYSWIINPPLWMLERQAALTLPGDLPPGDPRNFIRGDIPDFAPDVVGPNGEAIAVEGAAAAAAVAPTAGSAAPDAGAAAGGGGSP